ncbi:MAG: ribulose-phosphate 3-epimerase [Candidatus Omnitrophota bacterium]|nr:ribulose-phosphate 3-epimerase [Candidatus Omnitrophota bacterium]MBU1929679.1 ribulose-phosphate 3-epimerase [Candidatus Omnitrophota bacterium]MBU2034653.1 ribulose-phosphate 3-epimerase [Candidatus Omnitrophota bacterium]
MKIQIAPSILSADFSCLRDEIRKVAIAGADMLHIDVMDGHFVPNITIGPAVVKDIRKVTKLPLDVHLMIENPQDYVDSFVKAGADMITFHIETISAPKLRALSSKLKAKGIKVGISLNPPTPLAKVKSVLKFVDFVLVMSVNPGFGGQEFIPSAIPKIKKLRAIFKGDIAVDGGINEVNAGKVIQAGANILAAGSYIFKSNNCKEAIRRLRCQI